MDLYIGNPTRQDHIFAYRILERAGGPRMPTVRKGGQFKIPGDLTAPEIDAILAQHRAYGLVSVDEAVRAKQYVPLMYSIGKQITSAQLNVVLERNVSVLVVKGKEIRQQAAVAINQQIETTIREDGLPAALQELDVSVVEETGTAEVSDQVAEGTLVTRLADRMPEKTRRTGIGAGRRGRNAA